MIQWGVQPLTPHLGTPVNGTVVTDCHQHPISDYFPLDATAFQMVRKNIVVVWGAVVETAQKRHFGFWHLGLLYHRSKHKSLGRRQKDLSLINHRDKLLSSL